MEKPAGPETNEAKRPTPMALTGGVSLSEERLRYLAPQWEGVYQSLRRLDEIQLGETEPATLFVWRSEQP